MIVNFCNCGLLLFGISSVILGDRDDEWKAARQTIMGPEGMTAGYELSFASVTNSNGNINNVPVFNSSSNRPDNPDHRSLNANRNLASLNAHGLGSAKVDDFTFQLNQVKLPRLTQHDEQLPVFIPEILRVPKQVLAP